MASSLYLAAPWIASFYETPILIPLTRVLSLNLLFNAFGIIHLSILAKRVNFKTQMMVTLIATVLSGIIGITMAYRGFGVWSLVAQSLSINLFRTIFLWLFHSWRPGLQFSFASLRTMFSFGSKLLVSGLLESFFQNIYLVVIGKMFSPVALGFYERAQRLQRLPIQNIEGSVRRVTFPVFSSIQEDKPRLKQGVRKALMILAMVNLPMMIGLAVIARPLVSVLLTDKWLPCVPYLQLLCAVGMLYPLVAINLNVLTAQGYSDLFLKLELVKRGLGIVAIIIAYRWGIPGLIMGQIVVSVLSYLLHAHYTGKFISYPIKEQILDITPYLGMAIVMGIGIHVLQLFSFQNLTVVLIIQVASGMGLYVALCRVCRLAVFMECLNMIKQKLAGFNRA